MESGRFSATVLLVLCFFIAHICCCSEDAMQTVDRPMQKRFYSWEEGKRSQVFPAERDSMPLERMFKRRFYAWASQFQKRHALSDSQQL